MEKEKLKTLIDAGYSQRELALALFCSQANIKYWLKKFNIKTNNNKFNSRSDIHNKFCPKCEMTKPLSEFYKRYGRTDVGGYCKKCSNRYHRERIKTTKLKMIEYKGSECEDCKLKLIDSHYCVFEFHHLNPKDKDPNFDKIKFKKWETIKKEIDKCALLCSNCHRLRHAEIEGW